MTETVAQAPNLERTDETRSVEAALNCAGFQRVDAYRFNSAIIRLRVIDPRFEGLKIAERDAIVEPILATLPEETQSDIMSLFTFSPSEVRLDSIPAGKVALRHRLQNLEFEDPSQSVL